MTSILSIEAALRCMFIFIILARRSAKYFSYEVRVISKWFATIEKGKSPWPAKYYPLELEGHYPNISSKSGHMPNLWRFSSQRGFQLPPSSFPQLILSYHLAERCERVSQRSELELEAISHLLATPFFLIDATTSLQQTQPPNFLNDSWETKMSNCLQHLYHFLI